MSYEDRIKKAKTIADIFHIVKAIVSEYLGAEQAGLLVGLTDLGSYRQAFIGAFYSFGSNMIIINKRPLSRILQTNPSLYNYYLFHVLLHEYVHSLGSYDESQTRLLVHEISNHYFGPNHVITQLASDIGKFVPDLVHPDANFQPPEDISVDFIIGIDRSNTGYIG